MEPLNQRGYLECKHFGDENSINLQSGSSFASYQLHGEKLTSMLDSPTMDLAETPCGFSRVGWSATPCTSPAVGFHTTPEMPYANPKVGFPATPKTPCATPANNFSLPRCHGLLRCGTGSIGTSTRRPDHGGKRGEGRGELLHGTGSVGCGHGQIRGEWQWPNHGGSRTSCSTTPSSRSSLVCGISFFPRNRTDSTPRSAMAASVVAPAVMPLP